MGNITHSKFFTYSNSNTPFNGMPAIYLNFFTNINKHDDSYIDDILPYLKKHRNMIYTETTDDVIHDINQLLTNKFNPVGGFYNPHSCTETRLVFSGYDPMENQDDISKLINKMHHYDMIPSLYSVETNATKELENSLKKIIKLIYTTSEYGGLVADTRGDTEWFWNVFINAFDKDGNIKPENINPDIIEKYKNVSDKGQISIYTKNDKWDVIEKIVDKIWEKDIFWPIKIGLRDSFKKDITRQQIEEFNNSIIERGYGVI